MDKQLLKQRIQNEMLLRMKEINPFTLLKNLEMWSQVFTQILSEGISEEDCLELLGLGIFDDMPDQPHKFVCLLGIKRHDNVGGNKFFSDNKRHSVTRLLDGSIAYKVIGYADTVVDAQMILYGRTYCESVGLI